MDTNSHRGNNIIQHKDVMISSKMYSQHCLQAKRQSINNTYCDKKHTTYRQQNSEDV